MQYALGRASACAAACLLAACLFPLSASAYYTNAVTATTGVISTGNYSLQVGAVLDGNTLTVTNQNPQYACKLYVLEGDTFRSFDGFDYLVLPIDGTLSIEAGFTAVYAATSYQTLTPASVQGTLGNNICQVFPATLPEPLLLTAEEEGSDTPAPETAAAPETVVDPGTQPTEEPSAAAPQPPDETSAANEAEAPAEDKTEAPEEAPAGEEAAAEPSDIEDAPPEEPPDEESSSA